MVLKACEAQKLTKGLGEVSLAEILTIVSCHQALNSGQKTKVLQGSWGALH